MVAAPWNLHFDLCLEIAAAVKPGTADKDMTAVALPFGGVGLLDEASALQSFPVDLCFEVVALSLGIAVQHVELVVVHHGADALNLQPGVATVSETQEKDTESFS